MLQKVSSKRCMATDQTKRRHIKKNHNYTFNDAEVNFQFQPKTEGFFFLNLQSP
jgi:hypothetical protein